MYCLLFQLIFIIFIYFFIFHNFFLHQSLLIGNFSLAFFHQPFFNGYVLLELVSRPIPIHIFHLTFFISVFNQQQLNVNFSLPISQWPFFINSIKKMQFVIPILLLVDIYRPFLSATFQLPCFICLFSNINFSKNIWTLYFRHCIL